ncbi:Crp/Fnr family transcriptional regulator [Aestuariivita boseongensis]|uniref:Crp/Fnr family transcriptional regulator n=1 Tax=Aestuariivita boseongensis TaxID=1470562 RepID=UPI000680ECE3|nr:Crp/Fnr family transcriptional regulator [Aestuariivita boseongensis]
MATDCTNCPLRRKEAFVDMSDDEAQYMKRFKVGELKVEADTPILSEGSNAPQLYTVLRGMGVRYKLTRDGRRQVINFVFPGDFLGLQAGVMKEMGHSVDSVTPMTLCVFDRSKIWQLFRDKPERAFDLTWLASVEEHFLGESLLTIGQRDAMGAISWALARIAQRGHALDLITNGAMPFRFRQQDLADALGLSLVHTNKTLRRLREQQIVTWSEGRLHIHDPEKLGEMGGVDIFTPVARPLI